MADSPKQPAVRGFMLDEGLPRTAVGLLQSHGFDADHVLTVGLRGAADPAVLREAARRNLVAVTLDSDFHRILALTGAAGPSVVRLRIEGLTAGPIVGVLAWVLHQADADLSAGAAVTVTPTRLRVRRLPIRP